MKKHHFIFRAGLLGLACAAFTMLGGYFHTTAYASQVLRTESTVEVAAAANKVSISDTVSEKSFKNTAGQEVATYKYHKPVLEGSTAAIKKINDFYSQQRLAEIKIFKKETLPMQDSEILSEPPRYIVSDELNYEVTYNKNGFLCILQSGYVYTGGAHGMPYRISHTFDLNTGKEVALKNILALDKNDMTTKIAHAFNKLFKSDTESVYWEDALATVKRTSGYSSPFYLTKKGICFYYSPYDLAPYARGFVEVTLHYSTNKDILKISALTN